MENIILFLWIGVGLWLAYALAKDYDFWPCSWFEVLQNAIIFLFMILVGPAILIGFLLGDIFDTVAGVGKKIKSRWFNGGW